jgi:WD40 repeat protein
MAHTAPNWTHTLVTDKHQQVINRIAFAVVVGAGVATENPGSQMSDIGGRERASTGLLKVGDDVLSYISTFLSWEKVKLQRKWTYPVNGDVCACHISPCSRMILTSSGGNLYLWDFATGILKGIFEGHDDVVTSCRFFHDGKTAVSASLDCTVKMWHVATAREVITLVGHADLVTCVDVSPDDKCILSTSWDNTWKLWCSRTGDLQHTEQLDGCSYCCSFSPDGSLFLIGCNNGMRLHDSTTRQVQLTLTTHDSTTRLNTKRPSTLCSFAPDGITILSNSGDYEMKLWSATTGHCLHTLAGHSGNVRSCSFSPNGHELYTASEDGTLIMWTTATGRPEGIIDATLTRSWAVCTSPNGEYIVSGHDEGVIKVWRMQHKGSA